MEIVENHSRNFHPLQRSKCWETRHVHRSAKSSTVLHCLLCVVGTWLAGSQAAPWYSFDGARVGGSRLHIHVLLAEKNVLWMCCQSVGLSYGWYEIYLWWCVANGSKIITDSFLHSYALLVYNLGNVHW
jgi:hypothetical protein